MISVAERGGRTDLASRLRAAAEGVRRTGVTVAVVGEFKKGKSTLVNALVNADVCPSDPVFATVVPIVVGHAERASVGIELLHGVPDAPTECPLDQIAEFASEAGNLDNRRGIARVEVGLPRRLLATGLSLVDTPGVGGLDSALGALVLARLDGADGVLFVTDCSQELTAPELAYLTAARKRCSSVICVMTKLDLHPAAAAMAEKNRHHLARAGLDDVEVLTVSSVLHLLALAQRDAALETESGFDQLFAALHRRIWEPARRRGLAAAGLQMSSVAAHLALPLDAHRAAASSAAAATRTLDRLGELHDRVRQFRSTATKWQQRLADGMQELRGEMEHDLRARLRTVSRMAEARADADQPADDLVFEVWLHKAAVEAVIAHYEVIAERAKVLSDDVAEVFVAADRDVGYQFDVAAPRDLIAGIHINPEVRPGADGRLRRVVTTTQGYSSGMVMTSSLFALVGSSLAWLPFVTLPVAAFMARRAFSDDRMRRKAAHSQDLKRLANKYVDEISFVVQKDSRDAIRRLHRDIRDHYAERAAQLERTLEQAIAAAELARSEHGSEHEPGAARQTTSLEITEGTVRQLRSTADRLTGAKVAS